MIYTRKTAKDTFLHEHYQKTIAHVEAVQVTEMQVDEVQAMGMEAMGMQVKESQEGTACLTLEDGTSFFGLSCGARGEVVGNIRFNTAMIGYPEIISDPAYAGSILVMTYPQVGNYGVALADTESEKAALRGLVVRDMCHTPSNFRMDMSLTEYLQEQGIVALAGIDTRALFQHIRGNGSMGAILSTEEKDPVVLLEKLKAHCDNPEENLVSQVSCKEAWTLDPLSTLTPQVSWQLPYPEPIYKVVAIDCGITRTALRHLTRAACSVTVVPWDSSAEEIMALEPDGLFVSGGPGDPRILELTIKTMRELLGQLPVLGVGLGHQLIALAAGGRVVSLNNAHDGNNHSVMDLRDRTIAVTVQHHRYLVTFDSLGYPVLDEIENAGWALIVGNDSFGHILLSHIHAYNKSTEGMKFLDVPVLTAQYHPVFSPEAKEPHPLYVEFVQLMDGHRKAKAGSADRIGKDQSSGTEASHA